MVSSLTSDLVVSLASGDIGEATVPASVTIAAGDLTARFTVTGKDEFVDDGDQSITVSATSLAGNPSSSLTVLDDDTAVLSVMVDPTSFNELGGSRFGNGRVEPCIDNRSRCLAGQQ